MCTNYIESVSQGSCDDKIHNSKMRWYFRALCDAILGGGAMIKLRWYYPSPRKYVTNDATLSRISDGKPSSQVSLLFMRFGSSIHIYYCNSQIHWVIGLFLNNVTKLRERIYGFCDKCIKSKRDDKGTIREWRQKISKLITSFIKDA
jgi:hypothetical protein